MKLQASITHREALTETDAESGKAKCFPSLTEQAGPRANVRAEASFRRYYGVMPRLFEREDLPEELFDVDQLDISADLLSERVQDGHWFRLGEQTGSLSRPETADVRALSQRQSMLIINGSFPEMFDHLSYTGNVVGDLGSPSYGYSYSGSEKQHIYASYHEFNLSFTEFTVEPVVSVRITSSGVELIVNPDLYLFLGLEERSKGMWWDPRRSLEAMRVISLPEVDSYTVDIRSEYLLKYLLARQRSLLVAHWRSLQLLKPSPESLARFNESAVQVGSASSAAKALVHSRNLQRIWKNRPTLHRDLHLWFEVSAPPIDHEDQWQQKPSTAMRSLLLPTIEGPVAPARFKTYVGLDDRPFEGVACNFMSRVYFSQDVLTKYEASNDYKVDDDGSVWCGHYWALNRSTARIGNAYLATAIGDFAEGVPYHEWPHWQQFAVAPPDREALTLAALENPIPDVINELARSLSELNDSFRGLGLALGLPTSENIWQDSADGITAKQLKRVYSDAANDDEFTARLTLLSTYVLEAIKPGALRVFLKSLRPGLDMNEESPSRALGTRKLVERLTIVAAIIHNIMPPREQLADFVEQAEGAKATDSELGHELREISKAVLEELAPLAALYDIRSAGGYAHRPDLRKVARAAAKLGLAENGWHRRDYLRVLEQVRGAIDSATSRWTAAVRTMMFNFTISNQQ